MITFLGSKQFKMFLVKYSRNKSTFGCRDCQWLLVTEIENKIEKPQQLVLYVLH
jgi:hypothetical protein